MAKQIENPYGMYPLNIVPDDEWNAMWQTRVDKLLDPDALLSELLTNAEHRIATTENPNIRSHAQSVTLEIRELQRILKEGKFTKKGTKRAVAIALMIGWLDERCHALQFEPDVQHEQKRAREHGPALEKQKKARMTECLKKYDALEPDMKMSVAAKKCGVCVRTLRDYLKERKTGKG